MGPGTQQVGQPVCPDPPVTVTTQACHLPCPAPPMALAPSSPTPSTPGYATALLLGTVSIQLSLQGQSFPDLLVLSRVRCSMNTLHFSFICSFIHLKVREGETDGQRIVHLLVHSQMHTTAGGGPGPTCQPGTPAGSPTQVAGGQALEPSGASSLVHTGRD